MNSATKNRTVLVFENSPKWVPELQRQFSSDDDTQVRTITRLNLAGQLLATSADPVLLIELDAAPADCFNLLTRLANRAAKVPVIVIASKSMADLEWSVRELGAVDFRCGFVPGFEIAELCRKQWTITADTTKSPDWR